MSSLKKLFTLDLLIDILHDFAGAISYGLAINMFTAANNIAPGGMTGLATLINYILGVPIGATTLLLNIPLLLISYKLIGKKFSISTLKTVLILTITLDYGFGWVKPYTSNAMMAALFGGVFIGIGLGIILMRGSCTGGTDVASRLILLKAPYLSMGRVLMMVDCSILVLSVFVYGEIEPAMLGLISIFVSTRIMDSMLYGMDSGIMMFIVSDKAKEIGLSVVIELGRSATLLKASGAYSGIDRPVALCAVRRNESVKLRKLVNKVDPSAFIMVTEASEILGYGFAPISK